jgi:hypothetical protein
MAVLATIGMIKTGSITARRWGWIGSVSCPGGSDGCDKVLGGASSPAKIALAEHLSNMGAQVFTA